MYLIFGPGRYNVHEYMQPSGCEAPSWLEYSYSSLLYSRRILTTKVGRQTDLVLVCDQSSLVDL